MQITDPRSAEDIIKDTVWPDAIYDFKIIGAKDDVSKASNNEMIVIDLEIFDKERGTQVIRDYLLEVIPLKLRYCVEVCGIADKYNAGLVTADDFLGKTGRVMIKEDRSPGYNPKNAVNQYITDGFEDKAKPSTEPPAGHPVDSAPFNEGF